MTTSPAVCAARAENPPSLTTILTTGILFGLAGFAVNLLKLELFFNVDFLFGSIITMFALLRYGTAAGTIAALVAATCTWYQWHHPWAIIIITLEAYVAGLLVKKRRWELVTGDIFFWCSIGLLLVVIFYHQVMSFTPWASLLIALKQGVNGIFNTLVAMGLSVAFAYRSRTRLLPSLYQILFVSMALFVLIPAMGFLYYDIRRTMSRQLTNYRDATSRVCDVAEYSTSLWLTLNKDAVKSLAELTGDPKRKAQPELQRIVEALRTTNPEFKRMGIIDTTSVTQAFSPQLDEFGVSTIGLNLSDRAYIPRVKSPSHPFVFFVFNGKIGSPGPRLILLAPIVEKDTYRGSAFGVVDFSALQHLLKEAVGKRAMTITVIDHKERVVISTNEALKPTDAYALPQNGTVTPLENGVGQWTPGLQPGVSASKRWLSSFYVKQLPLTMGNGWKVVIESSLTPQLEELSRQTSMSLGIIAFLILTTITLSRLLAAKYSSILHTLEEATRKLPMRIASGEAVSWPQPMTREMTGLIANFQTMGAAIQKQVAELLQLNETLDQRVTERTEQLRENEQFTTNIINSLTSNIAVLDDNGFIVTVNESWLRFARENNAPATYNAYVGISYLRVCRDCDDEGAKGALSGIQTVLNGDAQNFTMEYPCHSPDQQRWFFMSVSRLTGSRQGVVVSHRNITERKLLENEVQQALHTATAANATMSRLLHIIAHEFRTPLGLMLGSADILDRYWDRLTPEKRLEQNEHIRSATRQLSHLINSVISFSRKEEYTDEMQLMPFDIGNVCRAVAAEVATVWGSGRECSVTIAADCGSALIDEMQLRRVLENLLTNAFRYTPPDGTVSLRVRRQPERILFEIADTGIGIPEDEQTSIFDAFYRSRNIGGQRGLGLGLSIVQDAVMRLGGTISVLSAVGKGTVMSVTIPLGNPGSNG